ncbi:MAG TPA: flagellar assembly protein FliW [Lachnospiraceae bacterium]|nr:flagellar assembly protein FliW [Lachnospiraceae bacterium]
MIINTRIFGEVNIDEEKVIVFQNGIIGFPELTKFALIHDEEKGNAAGIRWMQSLQETAFAMPVMDPLVVISDYNPSIEDELLKSIGTLNIDEMLVLVTVSVPNDLTKMSVNLKAPIIINANERKACQVIVENDDYQVKFLIYDILQAAKKVGD